MIVRHFLQWVRTAAAGVRAEATSALARAYLISDLSPDDRLAAEGAMIMLLDDPSPLVRRALAEPLAPSSEAPPTVIHALAADQPDIAAIVLERSPLLCDADLVDIVGAGEVARQVAIAARSMLPRPVAAALAEVGSAEACLVLVENPGAEITSLSLDRIAERFGRLGAIREALFAREDLPAATRQSLVVTLSETLGRFVTSKRWLAAPRAARVMQDACERATVTLAAASQQDEMRPLVRHLRESGQLTAGLVLRALLSGHLRLFEEALAELSSLPAHRVAILIYDRRGTGLRALFDKAGLPPSAFSAAQAALETMHETGFPGSASGSTRLQRRMVERVLTRCEHETPGEIDPLLILLRRFATEAARDEARLLCADLAAA
jgi:uncharacterized protein (DUF2336 family)